MSNSEINRLIVEEGLHRRKIIRERRDAELERDAQLLRKKINENHARKCGSESKPVKAAQKPQEATNDTLDFLYTRYEETRAQEAQACARWYQMLVRVFAPLLVAVFALSLSNYVSFWFTIPVVIAGITLSGLTIMVWCCWYWVESQRR